MIVNFGWVKDAQFVRPTLTVYCYRCQRSTKRELWRETEWVCFFTIKTIPFLWKHFLVCSRCSEVTALDRIRYRQLLSETQHGELRQFLEDQQLAQKNETQRNFLLAQRAESEAHDGRTT